jgi:hypothetical protein
MRTLLLILLLPMGVLGQVMNEKVLAFAEENLGKKIKNGFCGYLVTEALLSAGWNDAYTKSGYAIYGKSIKKEDLIPGDIVYYKKTDGNHVSIVKFVKENGELVLLEQNGAFKPKDRMVREVEEDWGNTTYKGGEIIFYRPFNFNKVSLRKLASVYFPKKYFPAWDR